MPAWLYSLGYNGAVVGVECAICIAISAIPALHKLFNRLKAQTISQQKAFAQA